MPDGGLAPEGMQTVELVTLCAGEPFQKWFGTKTKRRGAEYEALKEEIAEHYLGRELSETELLEWVPALRREFEASDYDFTELTYAIVSSEPYRTVR